MCAAPGSKSLQLLDALHAAAEDTLGGGAIPEGCLVVNDVSRDRALIIAQRSRRQPRAALLVLHGDARRFPSLKKTKGYKLKFDRVLCDVPCEWLRYTVDV